MRELQTALGLVAAQVGVTVVPESVDGLRSRGVVYRRIAVNPASSPIIISRRTQDHSPYSVLFARIARERFGAGAVAFLRFV